MPVARAASTVHDLRVLNSDDKTVARVTVDRMSVSYPARAVLAPRLTVTALRGYQAQADRLADILAAARGVTDVKLVPPTPTTLGSMAGHCAVEL